MLLFGHNQEMQRVLKSESRIQIASAPRLGWSRSSVPFNTCWYHCLCRAQNIKKNGMKPLYPEQTFGKLLGALLKTPGEGIPEEYLRSVSMFKEGCESTKALRTCLIIFLWSTCFPISFDNFQRQIKLITENRGCEYLGSFRMGTWREYIQSQFVVFLSPTVLCSDRLLCRGIP